MSADLHIHVYRGLTEDDLRAFFANTMGSKYFAGWDNLTDTPKERAYEKISRTPDFWIGEVSWLKAALFDDGAQFIPSTVQLVHDAIGEDLPVLTDELVGEIVAAFDAPNDTGYRLAKRGDVERFLAEHAGERLFTVSW